jgi:hypothetical protein
MRIFSKYFLILLIAFVLIKCANQQLPPGGPKDTEPPQILEVFPANGTLNYSENYFELTFSEYVDKMSLLEALFISPEINNLGYDWTGTTVEITFDDTLLENTTYTVSIGSNIKDLNNKNPMEEAINFSFSTGNKIDVGSLKGKVFDSDLTGTMVFAYRKDGEFANPIKDKAKNVTQVGENGEYEILGLRNGEYRVFAIKDEGGNRLYNIGDDMYGVASALVELTDSQSTISEINFRLTREDTIPPFISNVTMTDKHHLSVEYSEALDSARLNSSKFFIYDSTSKQQINPKYIYQGNSRKFEYFISFEDTLITDGDYYLIVQNIFDKYNNIMPFDSYQFVVNEKPDTTAPTIKSIATNFEGKKIDFINPSFKIIFNDGIDEAELKQALLIDNYKWEVKKENDALFEIFFLQEMEANQKIEFKFDYNKISDAAGNSLDSIQTFSVETLSGREFSGLSGTVNIGGNYSNLVVVINSDNKDKLEYKTKVDNNKS